MPAEKNMKIRHLIRTTASIQFVAAALLGCNQGSQSEPPVTVEEAATIAALSQGEDGEDGDFQDATNDAPEMEGDCHLGALRKRIKGTYDTNQDGQLDAAEQAGLDEDFGGPYKRLLRHHVMRRHRRHFLVRVYDANSDKALSAEEKAVLDADLEVRCENRMKQLFGRFDADADGRLDDAEWTAAREDLAARFAARRAKLLTEFDHDQDGRLDLEERYDARLALRQKLEDKRDAIEAKFDADGDSKLNDEERLALRESLRARIRGEQFKP
jgi:hypothetical protein